MEQAPQERRQLQQAPAQSQPQPESRATANVHVDRKALEHVLQNNKYVGPDGTHLFDRLKRKYNLTKLSPDKHFKIGAKARKVACVHVEAMNHEQSDIDAAVRELKDCLDITTNAITAHVSIPAEKHYYVIGKRGHNVRPLMSVTGCHIHFPETVRDGISSSPIKNIVTISGLPDNVEEARVALRGHMPLILSFVVPPAIPPSETKMTPKIKALAAKHDLTIFFKQFQAGTTVFFKGPRRCASNIELAVQELMRDWLPDAAGDFANTALRLQLDVPAFYHERFRAQYAIVGLMRHTQTQISFAHENVSSIVHVTGVMEQMKLVLGQLQAEMPISVSFEVPADNIANFVDPASPRLVEQFLASLVGEQEVAVVLSRSAVPHRIKVALEGREGAIGAIYRARRDILAALNYRNLFNYGYRDLDIESESIDLIQDDPKFSEPYHGDRFGALFGHRGNFSESSPPSMGSPLPAKRIPQSSTATGAHDKPECAEQNQSYSVVASPHSSQQASAKPKKGRALTFKVSSALRTPSHGTPPRNSNSSGHVRVVKPAPSGVGSITQERTSPGPKNGSNGAQHQAPLASSSSPSSSSSSSPSLSSSSATKSATRHQQGGNHTSHAAKDNSLERDRAPQTSAATVASAKDYDYETRKKMAESMIANPADKSSRFPTGLFAGEGFSRSMPAEELQRLRDKALSIPSAIEEVASPSQKPRLQHSSSDAHEDIRFFPKSMEDDMNTLLGDDGDEPSTLAPTARSKDVSIANESSSSSKREGQTLGAPWARSRRPQSHQGADRKAYTEGDQEQLLSQYRELATRSVQEKTTGNYGASDQSSSNHSSHQQQQGQQHSPRFSAQSTTAPTLSSQHQRGSPSLLAPSQMPAETRTNGSAFESRQSADLAAERFPILRRAHEMSLADSQEFLAEHSMGSLPPLSESLNMSHSSLSSSFDDRADGTRVHHHTSSMSARTHHHSSNTPYSANSQSALQSDAHGGSTRHYHESIIGNLLHGRDGDRDGTTQNSPSPIPSHSSGRHSSLHEVPRHASVDYAVEGFSVGTQSTTPVGSVTSPLSSLDPEVAKFWRVRTVAEVLERIGLGKYTHLFENEEVDLPVFLSLTEDDLASIGISSFGARRKIALASKSLQRMFSGQSDSFLVQVYALTGGEQSRPVSSAHNGTDLLSTIATDGSNNET